MVDWLRDHLGVGSLAGMFGRGDNIVHTPRVGEDGYVPLTDDDRDDDGPAQVRPMNASRIASYVRLTRWCWKWSKQGSGDDAEFVPVPAMFPRDLARPACDHPHLQPRLRRLRE
jgi:hypothetical protein